MQFAISPPLAASLYGLEVFAHAVEDHVGNMTRFVLVGRDRPPPAPGMIGARSSVFRGRTGPVVSPKSSRDLRLATSTSPASSPAQLSVRSAITASSSSSPVTSPTKWLATAFGIST